MRELLYANSVSGFVKALGRRKREEERRREKKEAAAGDGGRESAPTADEIDADTERRRAGLVALFRRYDRDGNGRLDAAEFREAAAAAGDPLTGSEVAKIFTALDIHGAGVSLDDFLAAVEVGGEEEYFFVFPFFRSLFSFFFFSSSFFRSHNRVSRENVFLQAEDFMKPASPLAAWLRAHAGGGSVEELPGVDQLL